MKIAFVTSEFPHPKTGSSGGIGTSILNLSKGLIRLGHEVQILVWGQNEDEIFEYDKITVRRIENIKFKGLSTYFNQKKIQNILNKLYDKNEIDIVEFPDWGGFSAFVNCKCPIIVKLHGSDTYFCHLDNRKVKFKYKFQEQKALRKANGIISVSNYTGILTNKLLKINRSFKVVPNCIDANDFKSNQESETNTILYFGTLVRKKGLLELPRIFNEVFSKNPNAKLILIGKDTADELSGSDSTWQLMQSLFDIDAFKNVSYLGSIPYSEIKKHIDKTAVCVFPTFAEALPVSWIEAMALSKSIVASNIGWANEVIDDGVNGYLEDPKNHEAFAYRINQLLTNADLRNKFGIEARSKVIKNFDIEVIAQKSVAYYSEFLK